MVTFKIKTDMIELTVPYVNSNGNSKESILTEIEGVINALTNVEDELAGMEYYNGRNGLDSNHTQRMREDHRANQIKVAELRKQYIDLYVKVSNI